MNNGRVLIKDIIKFVDAMAITDVETVCDKLGFSVSQFYRIIDGEIVSSVNEGGHFITTAARVKQGRDENGLFVHGNIIFHIKDDLNEVIVEQIGKSKCGCTEDELNKRLGLCCNRNLNVLVEKKRLVCMQIGNSRVYFTKRRWRQQLTERIDRQQPGIEMPEEVTLPISEMTKVLDELLPFSNTTRAKHEYSPLTKFKAVCTMFALRIGPYEDMEMSLRTNKSVHQACCGEDPRVMDGSTLCYFMSHLTEGDLTKVFVQLVKECWNCKIIAGKYLAVDATHLLAWYDTDRDTNRHPIEGAAWGRKSKKLSFFGYKLHIIVDCVAELPIAFIISSGNDADSTHFVPLLEFTKENYGELVDSEMFSDAGYWVPDLVVKAKAVLKTELYSAINPRRNKIWKNLKEAIRVFFVRYDRAPATLEELMAVIGQQTLDKYGIAINQTIKAEKSRLMRAVKERMNRNYRVAVERVFSRLKRFFRLNSLATQKWGSVKKHIIMSMIAMLLMALAMKRNGIPADKRKFVRFF